MLLSIKSTACSSSSRAVLVESYRISYRQYSRMEVAAVKLTQVQLYFYIIALCIQQQLGYTSNCSTAYLYGVVHQ